LSFYCSYFILLYFSLVCFFFFLFLLFLFYEFDFSPQLFCFFLLRRFWFTSPFSFCCCLFFIYISGMLQLVHLLRIICLKKTFNQSFSTLIKFQNHCLFIFQLSRSFTLFLMFYKHHRILCSTYFNEDQIYWRKNLETIVWRNI
jgi:hypothetical protein